MRCHEDILLRCRRIQDPDKMRKIFSEVRIYLDTFDDAAPFYRELLKQKIALEPGEAAEVLALPEAKPVIEAFKQIVKETRPTTPEGFSEAMKQAGVQTGAKGRALFMTIRVAATGSMTGLELPNLFAILGPDQVLSRISQVAG